METIFKRRSIRRYTSEPVSDEQVTAILKAAMAAPSAGNQQPWHFVVLRDPDIKNGVPDVHPYSRMVVEAPVAIAVCADMSLVSHAGMWEQDCAAATQNLLLAVTDLGLGAVWLGVHPREDRVAGLKKLLRLPDTVIPFALVPVGHPAESKGPADYYREDRIHQDQW
ncbi:MAG: nitroreductase family protein [Candidatus Lernaella stagnicola]|nr:nitroreductase family protein [Candidatus Lernaella stagnicola]